MTTHQELLNRQQAIKELAALIPISQRIVDIQVELQNILLPAIERFQLSRELNRLRRQERQLVASLAALGVSLADPPAEFARLQVEQEAALGGLIPSLDSGVPLALLPVRLETRFLPGAGGSTDLLVRIYPDDIHLDRHEPDLSDEEARWGRAARTALADAEQLPSKDEKKRAKLEAWSGLATRFGSARAAWIYHALDPNRAAPGVRVGQWNRAEAARALPERWLVRGYDANGAQLFESWTAVVPMTVETGPDPQSPANTRGITEGMRWMVEFGVALQAGMAASISLTAVQVDALRRLVVFGVRGTATPAESGREFLDLLAAHHYTDGLALAPQGTPTNNTADGRSGQLGEGAFHDLVGETAYAVEVASAWPGEKQSPVPPSGRDGYILGKALGAPLPAKPDAPTEPELAVFPFAHVAHANGLDQAAAAAMNRALWPATGRYFAEQMLFGQSTRRASASWGDFFASTVRGRGPLPALRVGDQPYGLLPVTHLRRLPAPSAPDLLVFTAFENREGQVEEFRIGWDVGLPAGLGWDFGAVGQPGSEPRVGWGERMLGPGGGMIERAALCIMSTALGRVRQVALLREEVDPSGHLTTFFRSARLAADGRPGAWSTATPVPPRSEDKGRLPAIAAFNIDPRVQGLIIARADDTGGYLRTWTSGQGALAPPAWGQPIDWQLGLPGALLDLSIAIVSQQNNPLLVLFTLVDQGQPRLYLQFAALSDIFRNQALNWSGPFPVAAIEPWLDRPRVVRLQAVPLRVASNGSMELACVTVRATGGGLIQEVLHCEEVNLDGSAAEWRLLAMADFPPGQAEIRGLAVAAAEFGSSPLPSTERGRAGWVNLLLLLRDICRKSIDSAPHLGRTTDTDADLLEVLGQLPAAGEIGLRPLLGPLVHHYWRWVQSGNVAQDYRGWMAAQGEPTLRTLRSLTKLDADLLQLAPDARLPAALFGETLQPWLGPLIEAGPLSETDRLAENYLQWLARATPQDIHDERYPGGTVPDALLYRLLRHATLQAYADAAVAIAPLENGRGYIYEPELVSLFDLDPRTDPVGSQPSTLTAWHYLVGEPPGQRRLDKELVALLQTSPSDPDPIAELRSFIKALSLLAQQPTAALDRLLRETLDLLSHRLDAWVTSFATLRLNEIRETAPAGLHLGGYGWVEWSESPLARARPAGGYIHAPSLAHATTAAVLRSAYLSHNVAGQNGPFALDLSSRRVRLALSVLEEVRAGRPLFEVLGYRFERALQNRATPRLVSYIDEFRQLAPIIAKSVTSGGGQAGPVATSPRAVVHGLTLLERWRAGRTATPARWDATTLPFDGVDLPAPNSDEGAALQEELLALDDIVDAVADLLLAESLFQVARGNPVRSGATLTSASSGEARPSEPEIARTPRTGVGVNHRLAIVLGPPAALPAGWVSSPRDVAEPRLSSWAAQLLGSPGRVRFRVQYEDAAGAAVESEQPFTAGEVGLSPLEVLTLQPGANPHGQSDLEARFRDAAMNARTDRLRAPNSAVSARLTFERDPTWPSANLSVPEWLEVARAVREMVVGSRALTPVDLQAPGDAGTPALDAADLEQRWTVARDDLKNLIKTLRDLYALSAADVRVLAAAGVPSEGLANLANLLDLPAWSPWGILSEALDLQARLDENILLTSLRRFTGFGIPGAVPAARSLDSAADAAVLVAQSQRLVQAAEERLRAAQGHTTDQERIERLFSEGFRVLPIFTPAQDIWAAWDTRRAAGDAGPAATRQWFRTIASVRAGARRLSTALLYAEAIGGASADFAVAQFPLPGNGASDRWVGGEAPPNELFPAGRTSIACHTPSTLSQAATPTLAGMYVDDWVETVPGAAEVTGVAFHYDAPGAQAPQAILLAVPPVAGESWSVDLIEETLQDTLELVRLRAVDGDMLTRLGHMLPALLFAQNVPGETIETAFLKPL